MPATVLRRTLRKVVWPTVGVLAIGGGIATYKWRLRPSWEKENHEAMVMWDKQMSKVEKLFLRAATSVILAPMFLSEYILMRVLNTTEVIDHDKLKRHIVSDRDGRALVSVANHASTMDDPFIITRLLPRRTLVRPDMLRWGVCSEELCFFNNWTGTFFTAGRVVPINRGGGVLQTSLDVMAEKVDEGKWIHFFPEGRVWQEGGLPLRDDEGRWCSKGGRCTQPFAKVGPMKWGIGRLIANAPKAPIVVPFFHMGMADIVPQDGRNEVISIIPNIGKQITIAVGDEVPVEDLIEEYFERAKLRASKRDAVRAKRRKRGEVWEPLARDEHSGEHVFAATAGDDGDGDAGAAAGAGGEGKADDGSGDAGEAPVDPKDESMLQRVMSDLRDHTKHLVAEFEREVEAQKKKLDMLRRHHHHPKLRIKPPDHDLLTLEEAEEEEAVRLALYSAIADRIWHALLGLEVKVRYHRTTVRGIEEGEQK